MSNKVVALVILIVAVIAIWSYNIGTLQVDTVREVKQACDVAHNEISGISEEKCGELQDKTNTEYMCDYNYNNCWLEVK